MSEESQQNIDNSASNYGAQGNFYGDVHFVGTDFREAITFLRSFTQQEQTNAVDKVVETLYLIAHYQKAVSELKTLHDALHELEALMSTYEFDSFEPDPTNTKLLRRIRKTWGGQARVRCEHIETLAGRLHFAAKPLQQENGHLTGPEWIVSLVTWRRDFELCLPEPLLEEVCELWHEGLDRCRGSLFLVDKELLEAAKRMDMLTDRVLQSIGNEPL
jgi:hypothetical protein